MGNFENAKVKVAQGWLQGYTEGNLNIFKGVPYAAPPVGALRFRQRGAQGGAVFRRGDPAGDGDAGDARQRPRRAPDAGPLPV